MEDKIEDYIHTYVECDYRIIQSYFGRCHNFNLDHVSYNLKFTAINRHFSAIRQCLKNGL